MLTQMQILVCECKITTFFWQFKKFMAIFHNRLLQKNLNRRQYEKEIGLLQNALCKSPSSCYGF